jgi:hypothetical protein
MSNMSYCMFENTFEDLKDCLEHMDDKDLSESEKKYQNKLINLCIKLAEDYNEE